MKQNPSGLAVAAIIFASFLVSACGANSGSAKSSSSQNGRNFINNSVTQAPVNATTGTGTGGGASTGGTTISTNPALTFTVDGYGNHAQHVCIPAATKLRLRIKPHQTSAPLLPLNTKLKYPDGTLVYDGTPALYSRLRVRLEIQGTAAAWDYETANETFSNAGDYSSHLRAVPEGSATATTGLRTPEYEDMTILGSDPNDGDCTYWERQLGKCTTVSSTLKIHEVMPCPAGQQKILISKIVSDYPCYNDKINWCKGHTVQTVPDLLRWSVTIQAVTENTKNEF